MDTNTTSAKTKAQLDQDLIYQLEGKPRLRTALPLGMQHVLAMFASNLAPIMIITGACGLVGADIGYFAGGSGSPDYGSPLNLSIAFGVLALVVILQRFGKTHLPLLKLHGSVFRCRFSLTLHFPVRYSAVQSSRYSV